MQIDAVIWRSHQDKRQWIRRNRMRTGMGGVTLVGDMGYVTFSLEISIFPWEETCYWRSSCQSRPSDAEFIPKKQLPLKEGRNEDEQEKLRADIGIYCQ